MAEKSPIENIPVDGVVLEGTSAVNESALTGESIPVDKAVGDKVSAATTNQSGFLRCEATRVGEDTTLAQIIKEILGLFRCRTQCGLLLWTFHRDR